LATYDLSELELDAGITVFLVHALGDRLVSSGESRRGFAYFGHSMVKVALAVHWWKIEYEGMSTEQKIEMPGGCGWGFGVHPVISLLVASQSLFVSLVLSAVWGIELKLAEPYPKNFLIQAVHQARFYLQEHLFQCRREHPSKECKFASSTSSIRR